MQSTSTFALSFILISGCLFATPAIAQEEQVIDSPNAIYLEALGPGVFYSINYDRRTSEQFSWRVGVSFWEIELFGHHNVFVFPMTANYLSGQGSSHFEAGAGVVPFFTTGVGSFLNITNERHSRMLILGTIHAGYRFQAQDGGFVFRIAATPVFSPDAIGFTIGLSLGQAF